MCCVMPATVCSSWNKIWRFVSPTVIIVHKNDALHAVACPRQGLSISMIQVYASMHNSLQDWTHCQRNCTSLELAELLTHAHSIQCNRRPVQCSGVEMHIQRLSITGGAPTVLEPQNSAREGHQPVLFNARGVVFRSGAYGTLLEGPFLTHVAHCLDAT